VELLTPKEIQRMLKVSLAMVYKWADRGQIPCVRIPCPGKGTAKPRNTVRFKIEDVLDFVERHYQNGHANT